MPWGSSAWIRIAVFKPLVLCLQTHWLRVKMNLWGLVWLETRERKAREKRKKGRGWVKREKCRRRWGGDLSIGCQIFQRMGARAHDKSYEASWYQKQDDCKERAHASGLSLSCFTSEIKTTKGEITAQVSKYSWELNTLVPLWPYCISTRESTKLQPSADFLPEFGNLFRSARYKVLSSPKYLLDKGQTTTQQAWAQQIRPTISRGSNTARWVWGFSNLLPGGATFWSAQVLCLPDAIMD